MRRRPSADAAGGDLLELVDDEQLRARVVDAVDRVERSRAGRRRAPSRASPWRGARQAAAADERDEAGPDDRRLAAPRRADDGDQPTVEHARRELGDQPLAPDEQVGVLRTVRGEGAVRLAPDPRRARPGRHDGPARRPGSAPRRRRRRGRRRRRTRPRARTPRRAPSRSLAARSIHAAASRRATPGSPSATAIGERRPSSSSAPSARRIAASSASVIGRSSIVEPRRSARCVDDLDGRSTARRSTMSTSRRDEPRRPPRRAPRSPAAPTPASTPTSSTHEQHGRLPAPVGDRVDDSPPRARAPARRRPCERSSRRRPRTYSTAAAARRSPSRASAAASSVRPDPGGPPITRTCPVPVRATDQASLSQASSVSRPTNVVVRAQRHRQQSALGGDARRAPGSCSSTCRSSVAQRRARAPARTIRRARAGPAGRPRARRAGARRVEAAHQERPRPLPSRVRR